MRHPFVCLIVSVKNKYKRFLIELFTHKKESTVKALHPPTDLFVEEIRTFCQLRSAEQKAALLTTLKIEAFREFEKKSGFCTVLI